MNTNENTNEQAQNDNKSCNVPIVLTVEQEAALNDIAAWWAIGNKNVPYRLGGQAGTGKSTLIQYIIERLGIDPVDVAGAGPTAKACRVIQVKNRNLTVRTLHSWLYKPVQTTDKVVTPSVKAKLSQAAGLSTGELASWSDTAIADECEKYDIKVVWKETSKLDWASQTVSSLMRPRKSYNDYALGLSPQDNNPYKLLIVDESSMVSGKVFADIKSCNIPTIMIGDPYQLPPVKAEFIFQQHGCNFVLNEIKRQGPDSRIIRLADICKRGAFDATFTRKKAYKDYPEVHILPFMDLPDEVLERAEIIITNTNASRVRMNRFMRQRKWRVSDMPVQGDELLIRANQRDGYTNGMKAVCVADATPVKLTQREGRNVTEHDDGYYQVRASVEGGEAETIYGCTKDLTEQRNFAPKFGAWKKIERDKSVETGRNKSVETERNKSVEPERNKSVEVVVHCMAFGYVMTCHNSQGSQADCVVIINEPAWNQSPSDKARWIYTAVTRAVKEVWVCQPNSKSVVNEIEQKRAMLPKPTERKGNRWE